MSTNFPANYLLANEQQTKQMSLVIDIPGVAYLTTGSLYSKLRYGMTGITYGGAGLVYGGLTTVTTYNSRDIKGLLSLDGSSMTITQTIEPEQGRGSVSQLNLAFVDKDSYMTQVISPGIIINEILGSEIKIFMGYQTVSWPEDYVEIFRGYVSGVSSAPGLVTISISDPNVKRRQQIFFSAKTTLSAPINAAVTTIPVTANSDFYQQILGPNGAYDTAIKTYLKINDEIIQYPATGFGTNTFTSCTRASRGTTAATAAAGDTVENVIEITDNAMDFALKLMLSGWNGNWTTGNSITAFVDTQDAVLGYQTGAIILPDGVDADRDYGLTLGDYFTTTGAANAANNVTGTITRFAPLSGTQNRIIYTSQLGLVAETMTPATISFRSQYDTYPILVGASLTPKDVDVARHQSIKSTYLSGAGNTMQIYQDSTDNPKGFIETELYLPVSCYSLTRYGRLSVNLTKPPIADQRLQFLTVDNILNADQITPTRATNNRKFFNEVDFDFDYDDSGNPLSAIKTLDTTSLNLIGISSVLPISTRGTRTSNGAVPLLSRRAQLLLSRYKRGAVQMTVKVNWEIGCQIEAGDVVALQDNGTLFITNFDTGTRDIGVQLFEVISRALDLKSGNVTLVLISGVGAQASDRYATISPSSVVGTGSTTSLVNITDSFGALFPGDEGGKWRDYIGQNIRVRDIDFTNDAEVVFTGFDPSNPSYGMLVTPALPFTPTAGMIVTIPDYPTSTDTFPDRIYKTIHAFLDPQVAVTAGVSSTVFAVGAGDIAKFFVGCFVRVHLPDYTQDSGDLKVTGVDTGTNRVTVASSMGFTPSSSHRVDLIGFADHGGAYRWI